MGTGVGHQRLRVTFRVLYGEGREEVWVIAGHVRYRGPSPSGELSVHCGSRHMRAKFRNVTNDGTELYVVQ